MKRLMCGAATAAISLAFVGEAAATEWNVSVWGKRRAFTEHVEKIAELVAEKTGGEFTMTSAMAVCPSRRRTWTGSRSGRSRWRSSAPAITRTRTG